MKKIILSGATIAIFGLYAFFLKSENVSSTQVYKAKPLPVEVNTETPAVASNNTKPSTAPVKRNVDCVYIPYHEDGEEYYYDDEEQEKNGYYKCTTIIVNSNQKTTPASTPVNTPAPVAITPPPITKPKSSIWKDGTFIGDSIYAYYGNVQVSATISNGNLSGISFLDYPQDRSTSLQKSNYALPRLKSEAINSQSANVNTISGVTYTSEAFIQSLTSALNQAKA